MTRHTLVEQDEVYRQWAAGWRHGSEPQLLDEAQAGWPLARRLGYKQARDAMRTALKVVQGLKSDEFLRAAAHDAGVK